MVAAAFLSVFSYITRFGSRPYSLNPRMCKHAQGHPCSSRARPEFLGDQVNCKILRITPRPRQAVGFDSGMKIFGRPCCRQMCCLRSFIAPRREHRETTLYVILFLTFIYLCTEFFIEDVGMFTYTHVHVTSHVWRSDDNFSLLSFHHVYFRD